jgi:hypothetical protein
MGTSPAKIGCIGLRAKTARAIVVALAGSARTPEALTKGEMVLATSENPALFQPYHAVMDLPWDRAVAAARTTERAIAEVAAAALEQQLERLRAAGVAISAVGVVGAPERDLATIASPHIRAHAAEGVLFRRVLETAAIANGLRSMLFPERDLESLAVARLGLPAAAVKEAMARFGKRLGRPWRADEKAAATAAWLALAGSTT